MPRFIHIDTSIQSIGGHHFDLASNIVKAATDQGWKSSIVTNVKFKSSLDKITTLPNVNIIPLLPCPESWRYSNSDVGGVRWELNARGLPKFSINPSEIVGILSGLVKEPSIKQTQMAFLSTKKAFLDLLIKENLKKGDLLFFGTACEFDLLCYTEALKSYSSEAVWQTAFYVHYGIYPTSKSSKLVSPNIRKNIMSRLLKRSLNEIDSPNITLFTTTLKIAQQLTSLSGQPCKHLNYPINERFFETIKPPTEKEPTTDKYEIALAGGFRDEQGSSGAINVLSSMFCNPTIGKSIQISMMVDNNFSKNKILTDKGAFPASNVEGLILKHFPLSRDDYFLWLADANASLFLYQPENYANRVSGVFLESLALGKPLIVMATSWMSRYLDTLSKDYFKTEIENHSFSELIKDDRTDKLEWSMCLEKPQTGQLIFLLGYESQMENKIPTINLQIDSIESELRYSFRRVSPEQLVCITSPLSISSELIILISNIECEHASFTDTLNYSWIRSQEPIPISAAGLVATDPDNCTQMVSELLNFKSHYHHSAKEAGAVIMDSHHPHVFLNSLVDVCFGQK